MTHSQTSAKEDAAAFLNSVAEVPSMTYDLPIEQILQPHLLTCSPTATISQAARQMHEAHCSSILIVDDKNVVGIWTERDALAIDLDDPEAFSTPISHVMSSPVRTLHHHLSVGEAALRFKQEQVRHYLVVDDEGNNRGILTQSDVVHNQGVEYFVLLRNVDSILTTPPLRLPGSATLAEAAKAMHEAQRDAVVVENNDELGILTERDIVRLISHQDTGGTAWDVASRPLVCVTAGQSLYHARSVFLSNRIRHLGVTTARGRLKGLITYADILAGIEHDYVSELQKALQERNAALSLSHRRQMLAEKVFETTTEALLITNAELRIESINPAFSRITGYDLHEISGKTPSILKSGRHDEAFYQNMWSSLNQTGAWQGEIWNRRKDGDIYPEWLSINAIKDEEGQVTNYVAVFSDITSRKEAEEQVRHMAYHDALTGLANRSLFLDHLAHAMHRAHRQRKSVAVMFLDLDRFKVINDTLGHAVGDRLLKEIAHRLSANVREGDTVARLGGDEFTIILEDVQDTSDVASIAQKLIEHLARPMHLDGNELHITTSIGISLYPSDETDAEALVKQADVAMYRAKERGRNNYQFFTADMNARAFERLSMENSLRKALERNEFVLHYQPRVDARNHQVTGMEALLRWNHPDFGLVPPTQFIPIAEETGLIVPIGEWVLRTACAQTKAWMDQGLPRMCVAVNVSARQFKQPGLVESVRTVLEETGLDGDCLELEITESIAMEHAEETVQRLHEIKGMGVHISMDDFGTGHSSLSYIKQFPIDSLKIDKSFLQDMSKGSKDIAIAMAISAMAESLNLKLITEGVETHEQLAFLVANNSDEVQGFYFSHPLPVDEFAALFKDGSSIRRSV